MSISIFLLALKSYAIMEVGTEIQGANALTLSEISM